MKKMLKNILLFVFAVLFNSQSLFSQQIVEVFGQLTSAESSLNNAEIQIKRDNEGWLNVKFSKRNGEFNLALPLNHVYTFRFKQPGTIEKQIEFSTVVPDDYSQYVFDPFFFMVRLESYSASPEIDTLFYNKPVGKIFFAEEFTKFDYDREYNLFVREKVKEMEQLVAERQKTEMDALLAESSVFEDKVSDVVLANDSVLTIAHTSDSLPVEMASINQVDPVITEATTLVEPVITVEKNDSLLIAENNATVKSTPLISTIPEGATGSGTKPEDVQNAKEKSPVRANIEAEKEKPADVPQKLVTEENNSTTVQTKNSNVKSAESASVKTSVEQVSTQTTAKQQVKPVPEPVPVSIGKPNGKEYAFKEDSDKQVTKVYLTERGRTIIYAMFQYNNGRTLYFKQNAATNDSIMISRDIFTNALR